jgi:two-component system, OmpR family, phosphate regulon sensor histidine kinase PhoR
MNKSMSSTATRTIWLSALLLLVGLAIGLIFDHPAAGLALTATIICVVQFYQLNRFNRWLMHRRNELPPEYEGVWGEVIAVVHRIYRRKQYHKRRVIQLLRSFRRVTAAMPEGAVLLNSENEILWFNRLAGEWLRLKRKRDFGMRIENLVRQPIFVEYLKREEFSEPAIVQMVGNQVKWLSFYLVTTRDAPQRLLIVRDVTRQVLLETSRKEFVANASHELRSPLTVISGYLDALDDDQASDSAWREPIAEMRRQADRMRLLIDDLLELSRLESDRDHASENLVDISGVLAVLKKDALALERRPHKIELRLDSGAFVRGSERELTSAFSNLINNAIKYTPAQGEVVIRYWDDAEGAYVSVADTGIGIAEEHLPRLTERFYRVDEGRARDMGGSGLGLAIVKHALQRHEAQLQVSSQLGKGSKFVCHFPRRIVQAPPR